DFHVMEFRRVLFRSLSYGDHAGSALPFREGKGTAWEGGQREPFIIKYPKELAPGRTLDTPIMAIDLLPTLAEITGAPLPELAIDGKSAWSVLTGKSKKSPQEAYFFYYNVNELFGVRYRQWKMYFPHTYRTMSGQETGRNGLPGEYKMTELEEIELYDVVTDPSETIEVADKHLEVVAKIKVLANEMRQKLGDSLLGLEGTETRKVGTLK